jgi:hypothetical protein
MSLSGPKSQSGNCGIEKISCFRQESNLGIEACRYTDWEVTVKINAQYFGNGAVDPVLISRIDRHFDIPGILTQWQASSL